MSAEFVQSLDDMRLNMEEELRKWAHMLQFYQPSSKSDILGRIRLTLPTH